jgi:hypothetical protein
MIASYTLHLSLTSNELMFITETLSLFWLACAEPLWILYQYTNLFAVQIKSILMARRFKQTLGLTQQIIADLITTSRQVLPNPEKSELILKLHVRSQQITELVNRKPFDLTSAVFLYEETNHEITALASVIMIVTIHQQTNKVLLTTDIDQLPTWTKQEAAGFIQAATTAMFQKRFLEFIDQHAKELACMVKFNQMIEKDQTA